MFKALTTFLITDQIPSNPENCQLAAKSESAPVEISATEVIAWASPYGPGHESFVSSANGKILMTVEKSQKLIPAAVLNQTVNEQLSIIRHQENREPSKRERAALKEKVLCEMTTKAFTKKQYINICIDAKNSMLLISSTQKAVVDACLDLVYKTFPRIELEAIATEISTAKAMTDWLRQQALPHPFTLMHECELKDTEDNSTIKFKGLDLLSDDVIGHLNPNTQVQKLVLVHDEKMQFTLSADFSVSGIKYLEYVQNEKANVFTENMQAEIDADFIVSADVIAECLNDLIKALGGISVSKEAELA